MPQPAPTVVFFDLDNTLSGTNSGIAIVIAARRNKLLKTSQILSLFRILLLYKLRLRSPDDLILSLGRMVSGRDAEDLIKTGREAAEMLFSSSLFKDAIEALKKHRENGAVTVLLSSAISEVCIPLARLLHIDKVICTELEKDGSLLTGRPDGNYCYGQEKKSRMTGFLTNNHPGCNETWYYADSFSDIPVLENVTKPVCVNADRKLRKRAVENGWEIVRWKKKISIPR